MFSMQCWSSSPLVLFYISEFLWESPCASSRAYSSAVLREHSPERSVAQTGCWWHPPVLSAAQGAPRLTRDLWSWLLLTCSLTHSDLPANHRCLRPSAVQRASASRNQTGFVFSISSDNNTKITALQFHLENYPREIKIQTEEPKLSEVIWGKLYPVLPAGVDARAKMWTEICFGFSFLFFLKMVTHAYAFYS